MSCSSRVLLFMCAISGVVVIDCLRFKRQLSPAISLERDIDPVMRLIALQVLGLPISVRTLPKSGEAQLGKRETALVAVNRRRGSSGDADGAAACRQASGSQSGS